MARKKVRPAGPPACKLCSGRMFKVIFFILLGFALVQTLGSLKIGKRISVPNGLSSSTTSSSNEPREAAPDDDELLRILGMDTTGLVDATKQRVISPPAPTSAPTTAPTESRAEAPDLDEILAMTLAPPTAAPTAPATEATAPTTELTMAPDGTSAATTDPLSNEAPVLSTTATTSDSTNPVVVTLQTQLRGPTSAPVGSRRLRYPSRSSSGIFKPGSMIKIKPTPPFHPYAPVLRSPSTCDKSPLECFTASEPTMSQNSPYPNTLEYLFYISVTGADCKAMPRDQACEGHSVFEVAVMTQNKDYVTAGNVTFDPLLYRYTVQFYVRDAGVYNVETRLMIFNDPNLYRENFDKSVMDADSTGNEALRANMPPLIGALLPEGGIQQLTIESDTIALIPAQPVGPCNEMVPEGHWLMGAWEGAGTSAVFQPFGCYLDNYRDTAVLQSKLDGKWVHFAGDSMLKAYFLQMCEMLGATLYSTDDAEVKPPMTACYRSSPPALLTYVLMVRLTPAPRDAFARSLQTELQRIGIADAAAVPGFPSELLELTQPHRTVMSLGGHAPEDLSSEPKRAYDNLSTALYNIKTYMEAGNLLLVTTPAISIRYLPSETLMYAYINNPRIKRKSEITDFYFAGKCSMVDIFDATFPLVTADISVSTKTGRDYKPLIYSHIASLIANYL